MTILKNLCWLSITPYLQQVRLLFGFNKYEIYYFLYPSNIFHIVFIISKIQEII